MKEIVFLNQNAERWKEFEKFLEPKADCGADKLAELYIQITDDLSFSRTYYPDSSTTTYLNHLAFSAHQLIYQNKKEKRGRALQFWKEEFPRLVYEKRKYVGYSFAIFLLAFFIGVISTAFDDTFVRLILGDQYVNMTLDNIDKGDPMAVYKKMNQMDMFLGISLNNIYVSMLAFVMGLLLSAGTAYILFSNGIMLGAFQYFFYQQGLLGESIMTIWIHGTFEIFAIIVSGGAGIMMGNSILFPGTLPRISSFTKGVKNGLKIIVGLIPVFLTAGLLEGTVTRLTGMPHVFRISIILASLQFIVWYFYLYPRKLIIQKTG